MAIYKTYEEAKRAYEGWKGKNMALMKEAQSAMYFFEKEMDKQIEEKVENNVKIEEPVEIEVIDNPIKEKTKIKRKK